MLIKVDTAWYPVLGLACLVVFALAVAGLYWLVSSTTPSRDID